MFIERIPRHSEHAEQHLLGALMVWPEIAPKVLDTLEPADFYKDVHQHIFEAAREVAAAGSPTEIALVADRLNQADRLVDVGGYAYLAALANAAVSNTVTADQARTIKEHAVARRAQTAARQLVDAMYQGTANPDDAITNAIAQLSDLQRQLPTRSTEHDIPTWATTFVDGLADEVADAKAGNTVKGLPSRFADLDKIVGGWRPGEQIIIGARPSVGKTAIGLNLALRSAQDGKHVLFVSAEMSAEPVMRRLVAIQSCISVHPSSLARIDGNQQREIERAALKLAALPLHVVDESRMPPKRIRQKALTLAESDGLDLIIIDYLQKLKPDVIRPGQNMAYEIGGISTALQDLAKELKVPVISLAQLSRESEKRGGKPKLSDLSDAGAIEKDADVVVLMHRDDYQDGQAPPIGEIHMGVAKNRNGPIGDCTLLFDKTTGRFHSCKQGV